MTEKLKVSKEVAEALNSWFHNNGDNRNESFLRNHYIAIYEGHKWSLPYESLNILNLSELAQAIYVGYIVEETMEEKLAKLFEDTRKCIEWNDSSIRLYMKDALEIAGIEVPNNYWYDKL